MEKILLDTGLSLAFMENFSLEDYQGDLTGMIGEGESHMWYASASLCIIFWGVVLVSKSTKG